MGWTGERAMEFKVRYIQAFNAMERSLRSGVDPLDVLRDPGKAIQLIGEYAARLQLANAATEQAVMQRDELAASHDRFASHDGSFTVTVTAKTLDVPPKKLFAWLAANQWIYRPGGVADWVAYQTKIQQGLMVMATHEITKADGDTKEVSRPRVTTKGMDKLSALLMRPKRATLEAP
jgi:phage antirepressor YoqD-like protein